MYFRKYFNIRYECMVWPQENKKKIENVVKTAGKIIGMDLPHLNAIYREWMEKGTESMMGDSSHPASGLFFTFLPSRNF